MTKDKNEQQNGQKQDGRPKKPSGGSAWGVGIGLLLGTAVGCWTDDLALWLCIGVSVGLCLGAAFDAKQ